MEGRFRHHFHPAELAHRCQVLLSPHPIFFFIQRDQGHRCPSEGRGVRLVRRVGQPVDGVFESWRYLSHPQIAAQQQGIGLTRPPTQLLDRGGEGVVVGEEVGIEEGDLVEGGDLEDEEGVEAGCSF